MGIKKLRAFVKLCELAAERSSNLTDFFYYMKPVFYSKKISDLELFKQADKYQSDNWTRYISRCLYKSLTEIYGSFCIPIP